MKLKLCLTGMWYEFTGMFNLRDEDSKGRLINLGSNSIAALYNVFITGLFYTGYLTMYGMTVTDAGILSMIPFIGNLFSVFSSRFLGNLRRRKPVLLGAKFLFYFLYIIATNLMPLVVTDTRARMLWFSAILLVAHVVYAPFAPGITLWFYRFYPADNESRAQYLLTVQMISSAVSCVMVIISSLVADAVSGSAFQNELIMIFRYTAFVLVLADLFLQSRAKEYDVEKERPLKLREVVTLPFRYKKFIGCMMIMFVYNFANLNGGMWSYHLLNDIGLSYTVLNLSTPTYILMFFLTAGWWRKVLRRYSWVKTCGISILMLAVMEIPWFAMTAETKWIYLPFIIVANFVSVGVNLSYTNILYLNLPEEDSTSHLAFNTLGCNLFSMLSLLLGTWITAMGGEGTLRMFGIDVYPVQTTCLVRMVILLVLGAVMILRWQDFSNERDIWEVTERSR